MFRILLLATALVAVLFLSGCPKMKIEQFEGTTPKLVLEDYFNGNTKAVGVLFGRNGEVKRRFTVNMVGRWDGQVLTLEEDFLFSDGEKQHRTWKVRRLDEHNYEGHAGDVVGKAVGKQHGSALNWSYVLAVPVDGTTYNITFDDWMFLAEDGILLNRAVMSKFGLRVGELFLSFRKL